MPDAAYTDADPLETYRRVHRAIARGETLKIRYYGGQQPGAVRQIKPIAVIDGRLSASECGRDCVKLFQLSKIAVVRADVAQTYVFGLAAERLRERRGREPRLFLVLVAVAALAVAALALGSALR